MKTMMVWSFFSDAAAFHVSGMFYKHNCRIWAQDNSYATVDVAMNSPKVILWCAIPSEVIVGQFSFKESTVDQDNYLDMLQNFFYPVLQKKKLNGRGGPYFLGSKITRFNTLRLLFMGTHQNEHLQNKN